MRSKWCVENDVENMGATQALVFPVDYCFDSELSRTNCAILTQLTRRMNWRRFGSQSETRSVAPAVVWRSCCYSAYLKRTSQIHCWSRMDFGPGKTGTASSSQIRCWIETDCIGPARVVSGIMPPSRRTPPALIKKNWVGSIILASAISNSASGTLYHDDNLEEIDGSARVPRATARFRSICEKVVKKN